MRNSFMLSFKVPGQPIPKGRPRLGRFGTFTPKKTVVYQKRVRDHASQLWSQPALLGAITVEILALFQRPKAMNRRKDSPNRIKHTKRGDADNVAKAILDSLNGLVWRDDSQVWNLSIEKHYTAKNEEAGVEVWIYMEETEQSE